MGKGAITYAKWNTHYPITPFSLLRPTFRPAFQCKGFIEVRKRQTNLKTNQKGATPF